MGDDEDRDGIDRVAILARRQRFIQLALMTSLASAPVACAQACLSVIPRLTLADGVFVSEVRGGSGCDGCEQLSFGDIITRVDGAHVRRPQQLETILADGEPHALAVQARSSGGERTVELRLRSGPMPLSTIEAQVLMKTPDWARRPLFGRTSPRLRLIDLEERVLDQADLRGRAHLLVVFDWRLPEERQAAAVMLGVLQKARADLEAAGVEPLMAQAPHAGTEHPPMQAADLQRFFDEHQLPPDAGGPLPPPRLLRVPNTAEREPEPSAEPWTEITLDEFLGAPPTILVLDEHGIVRWHSAGLQRAPQEALPPDQHTIIEAVRFALERL